MTAEEAIRMIEQAASYYPITDLDLFSQRAREDLALCRRQAPPPESEEQRRPDRASAMPSPEFSVPEKYRKNADVWIVFSAFVACFVDPVDFGLHVTRVFRELPKKLKVERLVLVSDAHREDDPEEIEFLDLERLHRDHEEMLVAVADIGRGLLGEEFDISDFTGGPPSND